MEKPTVSTGEAALRWQSEHARFVRGRFGVQTQYFPYNSAQVFDLPLLLPQKSAFEEQLPTFGGRSVWRQPFGRVRLSQAGERVELQLYAELGEERPRRLFLPFAEDTPNVPPQGRYVWAEALADGLWRIDFNTAHAPHCTYRPDGNLSCPVPPRQNYLPWAVEAGESWPPR